ncbi:MAG: SDR family NAD(P)-dependent oxidoreductase [bacterium]|nr:SDR family NAD(P)-dependent oxidoreductase [bacterium]
MNNAIDGGNAFFAVSAKSEDALIELARRYKARLAATDDPVKDICYTAARARSHFSYRLGIVAASVQGIAEALEAFLAGRIAVPEEGVAVLEGDNFCAYAGKAAENGASADPGSAREAARAYAEGAALRMEAIFPEGNIVDLPTYAFRKKKNLARYGSGIDVSKLIYGTYWEKIELAPGSCGKWQVYGEDSLAVASPEIFSSYLENGDLAEYEGVLFSFRNLGDPENFSSWPDAGEISQALEKPIGFFLAQVKHIIDESRRLERPVRLAVLTCQAAGTDVLQHVMVSLMRVLLHEHPELDARWIDGDLDAEQILRILVPCLSSANKENQVAYFDGWLHGLRFESRPVPVPGSVGGTWLVAGGGGELGTEVCCRLLDMGAERVVALSRRALDSCARLRDRGTRELQLSEESAIPGGLCYLRGNISDSAFMERVSELFSGISFEGIVHCAATLDDGVFTEQSWKRFPAVLAPKAEGTLNLHKLSLLRGTKHFILFSSIASLIGSAGQANYSAANGFLDGFARYRRAQGLPCLLINWGPWEIGLSRSLKDFHRERLEAQGALMLKTADGIEAFSRLCCAEGDYAVCSFDWDRLAGWVTEGFRSMASRLLAEKAGPAEESGSSGFMHRAALEPGWLAEAVAALSGVPARNIDPGRPLSEYGIDSLMAIEYRNLLSRAFNALLPASFVLDYPAIEDQIQYLQKKLSGSKRSGDELEEPGKAPVCAEGVSAARESNGAIAIIGIGCHFPGGADDPDSFWNMVMSGQEAVGPIPKERFDVSEFYDPKGGPGKMVSCTGGFIKDVDRFDAAFFGITPREATAMDPQHRLLLQTVWEALENACLVPGDLKDTRTGVFIGQATLDYYEVFKRSPKYDAWTSSGSSYSAASGRLAYQFGFKGPAITVDTACSSALTALHFACSSLRNRECDLAVVGGVNLILLPEGNIRASQMGVLSPSGHIRAFDDKADGLVRAEGCGIVILKRMEEAVRDGDIITAAIIGSALNQDGRSNGMTAPNGPSQEAVMKAAWESAGITPSQLGFVEAHGTGTVLSDSMELEALGQALADRSWGEGALVLHRDYLAVGSIKSQIGHSEAASGMAGLIKAALAIKNGFKPANVNFSEPTTLANWDNLPVRVLKKSEKWDSPRYAGVTGLGLSGTNAHIVLAQPSLCMAACDGANLPEAGALEVKPADSEAGNLLPEVMVCSGRTESALKRNAERLAEADIWGADSFSSAAAATLGRAHFVFRTAVYGNDPQKARGALLASRSCFRGTSRNFVACGPGFCSGRPRDMWSGLYMGAERRAETPPIGFVLNGDKAYEEFAAGIDAFLLSRRNGGYSERLAHALEVWRRVNASQEEADGAEAGAMLKVASMHLWALFWMELGVRPLIVEGCGYGELAAASVAGALSIDAALELARLACVYEQALRGNEQEKAAKALTAAKSSCVLGKASVPARLASLASSINEAGLYRPEAADGLLSAWMQGSALTREVSDSSSSASFRADMEMMLWEGADEAWAKFAGIFGGSDDNAGSAEETRVSKASVSDDAGSPECALIGRMRGESVLESLSRRLAFLYAAGFDIKWQAVFSPVKFQLPSYAWEKERFWIDAEKSDDGDFNEIEWVKRELPVSVDKYENAGLGSVCVLSSETEAARLFEKRLREAGAEKAESFAAADDLILYFKGCGDNSDPRGMADNEARDYCARIIGRAQDNLIFFLDILKSLASVRRRAKRRLWLVTEGACPEGWHQQDGSEQERPDLTLSPLWPALRSAVPEFSDTVFRAVDVQPCEPGCIDDGAVRYILASSGHVSGKDDPRLENEIALRGDICYAPRLRCGSGSPGEAEFEFSPEEIVYVTGGAGGLAVPLACEMMSRGARRFFLVSRHPGSPAKKSAADSLRSQGAEVTVYEADVSDFRQVSESLEAARKLGPLAGVIHAAGLADVALITEQNGARLKNLMAPKAGGALNLHILTSGDNLRFFAMYSSVASVMASPGQYPYSAANGFLDALADLRQMLGMPVTCVNWGAFIDGGMPLGTEDKVASVRQSGMAIIKAADGAKVLCRAMASERAHTIYGAFSPAAWLEYYPQYNYASLYMAYKSGEKKSALLARLEDCDGVEAATLISGELNKRAAKGLGLKVGTAIPQDKALIDLGFDSLMAIELRNGLERDLNLSLPAALIFEYPTLEKLTIFIMAELTASRASQQSEPAVPEPALPADPKNNLPCAVTASPHEPASPATPGTAEMCAATASPKEQTSPASLKAALPPGAAIASPQEQTSPASLKAALPLAIIGIGCRFPGGIWGPKTFWQAMLEGRDGVREVSPERWNSEAWYSPEAGAPGKMVSRSGGFMDYPFSFDAAFFGISRREACACDPQQRQILETVQEALEDAGIVPSSLEGSATSVFLGLCSHDYLTDLNNLEEADAWWGSGLQNSVAAGRISFNYGLRGPAAVFDTACSSSLIAVHAACRSLRSGESDLAIAGGVNLVLSPGGGAIHSLTHSMSPDGRCHTFAADASGFARSDGSGAVILKRLDDAVADGDRIYAVINGTASGQDGRSAVLTAPNREAQEEVIARALADAGLEPGAVDYVEADGSATPLGDSMELGALRNALGKGRGGRKLYAGSVKTNFGHCEGAAGIAGLIKAALSVCHRIIPPHIGVKQLTEYFDFEKAGIEVPRRSIPWPSEHPVSGVSAFGMSGTNVHVILSAPPKSGAEAMAELAENSLQVSELADRASGKQGAAKEPAYVLPVSAKDPAALSELCKRYAALLRGNEASLAPICMTAASGREHYSWRFAAIADSELKMAEKLEAVARAGIGHEKEAIGKIAFCYSGEYIADTWDDWLSSLPAASAAYRKYQDLAEQLGLELAQGISKALLIARQHVLAELLSSWNIKRDISAGTDAGVIGAAWDAGILSDADALRLADAWDNDDAFSQALESISFRKPSDPRCEILCGKSFWNRNCTFPVPAECEITVNLESGYAERCGTEMSRAIFGADTAESGSSENIGGAQDCSGRIIEMLAAFYGLGADICWKNVYQGMSFERAALPLYPLRRNVYRTAYSFEKPRISTSLADELSAGFEKRQSDGFGAEGAGAKDNERLEIVSIKWSPVEAYHKDYDGGELGGTWLVISSDQSKSESFGRYLANKGCNYRTVSFTSSGDMADDEFAGKVRAELEVLGVPDAVAFLACETGTDDIFRSGDAPELPYEPESFEKAAVLVSYANAAVKAVSDMRYAVSPQLFVVTSGACAAFGTEPCFPQASLWGWARTVFLEHPELNAVLLDLPCQGEEGAGGSAWMKCLGALREAPYESQCAFRLGRLYGARFYRSGYDTGTISCGKGSYIVSGAYGALGIIACELLVSRGAERIVAIGRHKPSAEAEARLEKLRENAEITEVVCDIADSASLAGALAPYKGAIRGVIHAAGALDDAIITDLSRARFEGVMAPKIGGAINLYEVCRHEKLDFFAAFGSSAGVMGSAGQANYAAANAALDSFMMRLRLLGVPAVAIDWGAWDQGMGARLNPVYLSRLSEEGISLITKDIGIKALEHLLANRGRYLVIPINWEKAAENAAEHPMAIANELLGRAAEIPVKEEKPARIRYEDICRAVNDAAANIIGTAPDNPETPFVSIGLDSLMALEMRNALSRRFGCSLAPSAVFDYPTSLELSQHIADTLGIAAPEKAVPDVLPVPPVNLADAGADHAAEPSLAVGSEEAEKLARENAAEPCGADVSFAEAHTEADGKRETHGSSVSRLEPLAVIGVACRLPGGVVTEEGLREFLMRGGDAVSEVPASRWNADDIYCDEPGVPGRANSRWGGFIDDYLGFDAAFFGIPPYAAEKIDPQQRLLLETAFEALDKAGCCGVRFTENTGVFVGLSEEDFKSTIGGYDELDAWTAEGSSGAQAAGRISRALGFTGPAMTVNTACSSALVGIHLAASALRMGDCDLAVAGGVTLLLSPAVNIAAAQSGILSPEGRCKPFSADADGLVWSEGCCCVVLKRLAEAEADHDRIIAVLHGTSAAQEGREGTISRRSVTNVMERALKRSGISGGQLNFVEAFGIGIKMSDAIEANAIASVVGEREEGNSCFIGSIKSNFGHTMSASGAAAFIKAALSLEAGVLPPTLHCAVPSDYVMWPDLGIKTASHAEKLPELAFAAVNSFGNSGTNACAVLSSPERVKPGPGKSICPVLLSAPDEASLRILAKSLGGCLREGSVSLDDVAFTMLCRRHFPVRAAFVANDAGLLASELSDFAEKRGDVKLQAVKEQGTVTLNAELAPERLAEAFVSGASFAGDPQTAVLGRIIPLPRPAFRH